jgi:hypothetical protein
VGTWAGQHLKATEETQSQNANAPGMMARVMIDIALSSFGEEEPGLE